MGTINIGIGHYYDAAVAQVIKFEILARAHTQCQRQIGQFLIGAQFFRGRACHIQNFTTQRQHGLGLAVSRLLC